MVDHSPNTQLLPYRLRTPEEQIFDWPTVPPTRQTTLMTKMRSQTRGRSVTRRVSLTPEAIIINDKDTPIPRPPSSLYHALLCSRP